MAVTLQVGIMSIGNINNGPTAIFDTGRLDSLAGDSVGARAGSPSTPRDWFSALDAGESHPITADPGLMTTDNVDSIVNDMLSLLGLPG